MKGDIGEEYVEGEEVLLPHDAVRRDVGLVVAELAVDDEASELATPEEVERLGRVVTTSAPTAEARSSR